MKKRIFTTFILSALAIHAIAQDENDALRYGMSQYFGTARGMAIGNATGSSNGITINVTFPSGAGISTLTVTPVFACGNGIFFGSGAIVIDLNISDTSS